MNAQYLRRTHRNSSSKSDNLTGKPDGCWRKSNQCYHMTLKGLSMAARRPPGHSALSQLTGTILATRHPTGYSGLAWPFGCRLMECSLIYKLRIVARCGAGDPISRRWLRSESYNTWRGWSLPLRQGRNQGLRHVFGIGGDGDSRGTPRIISRRVQDKAQNPPTPQISFLLGFRPFFWNFREV